MHAARAGGALCIPAEPTTRVFGVRFSRPVRRRWRDIQSGAAHTCAINQGGRAFCWGTNFNGELGDGTIAQRTAQVAVSTTLTFKQVSTGRNHTCAVTTAGVAYCWGSNATWRPFGAVPNCVWLDTPGKALHVEAARLELRGGPRARG